jgi:hypothetical protein
MTKQEQLQRFDDLVAKLRKTLEDKGHDYAGEDVLSNFKDSGKRIGKTPQEQCLSLISTKVSRLSNLLSDRKKTPKNEAIQDSILDLIGYSFLLDSIIYEPIADIEGKLMKAFHKTQQDALNRMHDMRWGPEEPLKWVDIFETKEQIPPNSFKKPAQVLREDFKREIERLQNTPINTQQNFDDKTKVFGGPDLMLDRLRYALDFGEGTDVSVTLIGKLENDFDLFSYDRMKEELEKERQNLLDQLLASTLGTAFLHPFIGKEELEKQHKELIPLLEKVLEIEKLLGLDTKQTEATIKEIKTRLS